MENLKAYLGAAYTSYQATELAVRLLTGHGYVPLSEGERWDLKTGGKYFVVRGGSSLIAFRIGAGNRFKIVASHTDSPSLKLKENAALSDEKFTRLNTEPYGGGILYSFFDRPLKLAGRAVYEENGELVSRGIVSPFCVTIPSLAIHMNRDVNEKFAPNPQTDLSPLLSLGKAELREMLGDAVAYDLYAVCAEQPFESGIRGEFLSSPRIDNLTSVYASLTALLSAKESNGIDLCACFDSEEIGSRTRQGAGSDFLRAVLARIGEALGMTEADRFAALSSSFCISLDNAHSVHPNRPEKCDPTNRAAMGEGVVIKGHAGGAYTTDAMTSAIVKKLFDLSGVRYQTFFNRSDMRSGSTLGAISLSQAGIPTVDLGLAQLAMHSAVETMAKSDYSELIKGLTAFFGSEISIRGDAAKIE